MSETSRIADQLARAIDGDAWHGPSLFEILDGVTAAQASAHPWPDAHSIWEIVLHCRTWLRLAADAIDGVPTPEWPFPEDWPTTPEPTEDNWSSTRQSLLDARDALQQRLTKAGDELLSRTVPGRNHSFYYMLHGNVQHVLYHAGQIVLLKKALA